MKYIKTYEKVITLDLTKNEIELLMSNAIERNNTDLVKQLFDNDLIQIHL